MYRRDFLKYISILSIGHGLNLNASEGDDKLPALFIGHGSPMNALNDNEFSRAWIEQTKDIKTPKAILVISAHWLTDGTKVHINNTPRQIYDFYGFPQKLYDKKYNPNGAPFEAKLLKDTINNNYDKKIIDTDNQWGLDHGSWCVLSKMYPKANIPVFQMSIDQTKPLSYHYALAKEIAFLRQKGVLIIGSGNIVHNLREIKNISYGFEWANEFDENVKKLINKKDHDSLINYGSLGLSAHLSVNSMEHYVPLIYTLALQEKNEKVEFFNEKIVKGSISMRCLKVG